MVTAQASQIQRFSLISPFRQRALWLIPVLFLAHVWFCIYAGNLTKGMALPALTMTLFVWTWPAISIWRFNQSEKIGNDLEIDGNSVRLLGKNGVVKYTEDLANVTQLRAIHPMNSKKPEGFAVHFSSGRQFIFRDDVATRPELVALLEQRTGLKFTKPAKG